MSAPSAVERVGSGPEADLSRTRLILAVTGMVLTLLTVTMNQALAIIAMPRAITSLNGFARYSWPTTSLMLTTTIAMLVVAKLSDLYGRKRVYLYTAVSFVVSMVLCGMAGTLPLPIHPMNQFIVARGFLGIGNGAIIVLTYTLVADLFPASKRGRYQGFLAALSLITFVIGPGMGGWVTDHLSWRWAYYVDVPLGVIAIVVVYCTLPDFRPRHRHRAIDWAGVTTLCGWLVPLLLALTFVGQSNWSAPRIRALLIVSAGLLVVFLVVEKRAVEPLLVLKLFRQRHIAIMSANFFLMGITRFGTAVYFPLFLQGVVGVSAAKSGIAYAQYTLSLMAGNVFGGHLLSRTGAYRSFAIAGAGLSVVGLSFMSRMHGGTTQLEILRNAIICGIGFGVLQPTYEVMVQNAAPREQMGAATGFTQFFKIIGGTLGLALFGTMLLRFYHLHVDTLIPLGMPTASMEAFDNPLQLVFARSRLETVFAQMANGPMLLANLLDGARMGLLSALRSIFLFCAGINVLSFVLNLFLGDLAARKKS